MKITFCHTVVFTFLFLLIIGASCSRQNAKESIKENTDTVGSKSVNQQNLIASQSLNKGDNVHCSLQDQAGNLWFGTTSDGIYQYDGKSFTQFVAESGLNNRTIWSILEDKNGVIWIGTADGVYQFVDGNFAKVQVTQPNDPTRDQYDVWSIMQDSSGNIWLATGIGVYVYDGNSFTPFNVGTASGTDCKYSVEKILEDQAGNFWFGGRCNPGVYKYDGKNITHLLPNKDDWTWPVLQDKKGNIWFSSWNGAYRYDGKSFKTFTKADGLAGNMVARIVEDKKGNLWFGGDGLSRYDGKSFTHFTTNDGLTNTSIWTILEDNSGGFWIGTRETGLYFYDGKRFTKFSE
ncbi:MAG: two-component regulator propeller domain-containing protein [Bacteroidota bacterium]